MWTRLLRFTPNLRGPAVRAGIAETFGQQWTWLSPMIPSFWHRGWGLTLLNLLKFGSTTKNHQGCTIMEVCFISRARSCLIQGNPVRQVHRCDLNGLYRVLNLLSARKLLCFPNASKDTNLFTWISQPMFRGFWMNLTRVNACMLQQKLPSRCSRPLKSAVAERQPR